MKNWIEEVFPETHDYKLARSEAWAIAHGFKREGRSASMRMYSYEAKSKKGGKNGAWMTILLTCYIPDVRLEGQKNFGWKAIVVAAVGKQSYVDSRCDKDRICRENIEDALKDCKKFIFKGVKLIKDYDAGKIKETEKKKKK